MKKEFINEIKRMKQLAGILNENTQGEILDRLRGNVNSPVAMYSLILKVIEPFVFPLATSPFSCKSYR
jgi:hypothetical protein